MASEYAVYDFVESFRYANNIRPQDVSLVMAAYGKSGDYAEWDGGFLLQMKDGRIAHLSGGCDTTGWGCQCRAEVVYVDRDDDVPLLKFPFEDCDLAPADLNNWLKKGYYDIE